MKKPCISASAAALPKVEVVIQDRVWADEFGGARTLGAFARRVVKAAWKRAGITKAGVPCISLFFDNDKGVHILNREYRGVDKPTNVLSFPALEEDVKGKDGMPYLMGDIVLAFETCQREASGEENCALSFHTAHLIVHGVLHLAGFDHMDDDEAEEMEGLEALILKDLKL